MLKVRARWVFPLAITALAGMATAAVAQTPCPHCWPSGGYQYQMQPVYSGQVQMMQPAQWGSTSGSNWSVQPTSPTWVGRQGGTVLPYQRGYRGMVSTPSYGQRPGYVRVPGETFSGQYGNTFGLGWSPAMGMGVPSGPPGTGIGLPSMGR